MSEEREPFILGIDEAGRGPVLGPLVYGTCFCPLKYKDKLKDLGFADSKVLSEEDRERLFETIKDCEWLQWLVDVLSPEYISGSMTRQYKTNLNTISHQSAMDLIEAAVRKGYNITEAYIDTVGPPETYERKLSARFPGIRFTVAKKADSKYPIVSAASICAKVTRDEVLKNWKYPEPGLSVDGPFGSGYPSDPTTKQFIRKNIDSVFGFPSLVRFSWSTASKLIEANCVDVDWGEEDDAAAGGVKSASLSSFGFGSSKAKRSRQRAKFFRDRHLSLDTANTLFD